MLRAALWSRLVPYVAGRTGPGADVEWRLGCDVTCAAMPTRLAAGASSTASTCPSPTRPTPANSTLVNRLKGVCARELGYESTGRCNRARTTGHLWSPSYFAVSCGSAPLSIIKRYIEQQQRPA